MRIFEFFEFQKFFWIFCKSNRRISGQLSGGRARLPEESSVQSIAAPPLPIILPLGSIGGQKTFFYVLNQVFGETTNQQRTSGVRLSVANNYWTSSTNAGNTSNAWNVNFNNGNTNNNGKSNNNYVRCVRGKSIAA